MENILTNLVRVGYVTDRDTERHRCRVKYPDTGITSGWLYVLQRFDEDAHIEPERGYDYMIEHAGGHQHPGSYPVITTDGGHVHTIGTSGQHDHPGSTAGDEDATIIPDGGHGHSMDTAGAHTHPGSTDHIVLDGQHTHGFHARSYVTWWTPRINDKVLVLYVPTENGDGFVLGGIF